MILTNVAVGIGSGCVKIAQRYPRQAMSFAGIDDHLFDQKLGVTIGVDGILRMILFYRNALRNAVGDAGR